MLRNLAFSLAPRAEQPALLPAASAMDGGYGVHEMTMCLGTVKYSHPAKKRGERKRKAGKLRSTGT